MSVNDARIRLHHMIDAAYEVVSFTTGRNRADLDSDQMLLRAVSMSAGIMGEAAAHLDPNFRKQHSQIPWQKIIGLRNFLFHEYFRVDPAILWETATSAIPEVIPQLEELLAHISD